MVPPIIKSRVLHDAKLEHHNLNDDKVQISASFSAIKNDLSQTFRAFSDKK
jgi:hypothetical protein